MLAEVCSKELKATATAPDFLKGLAMAGALNEESVEKKLKTVNNTQDSIQSLSLWIIHHKTHHERICQLWMRVLKKTGMVYALFFSSFY